MKKAILKELREELKEAKKNTDNGDEDDEYREGVVDGIELAISVVKKIS